MKKMITVLSAMIMVIALLQLAGPAAAADSAASLHDGAASQSQPDGERRTHNLKRCFRVLSSDHDRHKETVFTSQQETEAEEGPGLIHNLKRSFRVLSPDHDRHMRTVITSGPSGEPEEGAGYIHNRKRSFRLLSPGHDRSH